MRKTRRHNRKRGFQNHRGESPRLVGVAMLLAAVGLAGCGSDGTPRPDRPQQAQQPMPTTAVDRAQQLRAQGISDEALAEFERAIAENPNLTVAYLGAGAIYREKGDYTSAETRYRRATELEPSNFDAQFGLALTLQLLDRSSEAVRSYLRALSIRPDDFESNLNLGTTYLSLGEPAQARPYAERAVRLNPGSGPARVNLGAVYAQLAQHEAAVIEYQQAAELMDLNAELLLNWAGSLGEVGRYSEMASTLQQLTRLYDTGRAQASPVAYERLGSALFRLKRYDEALVAFARATEVDPLHYPAWNGIGVCRLNTYLWTQRQDQRALREAIDALRRSLRIESNQPKIVELVRRYG